MENVRRKNKLKRIRQRRNKKIFTVFAVLGVILTAVMVFFYRFRVTDVEVAGNTRHSDEMIIQYVQEDLLTTNTMLTSWFRKSIQVEDIPFVESLDLEALDNNTIRIYVNEKQIVGYMIENDHKMFFDKDGYVLEIMPVTEAEQQEMQAELERYEQLRREEEGLPPETENPDGESPDGENPDGESPDGESPDGESPDGENPDGENPDGENLDGENPDGENPDGENSDGENPDGENLDGENPSGEENQDSEQDLQEGEISGQTQSGEVLEDGNESLLEVEAPQVPWVLGLETKEMTSDTRIVVEDYSVFNTIQGIWSISSNPDYNIIPERVLLDEEQNITLVYQNGTILCQLGKDTILEEKIIRVAAVLPTLTDKMGILHLEDYVIGGDFIFSQESEYTVMSKINKFLQKNS